MVVRNITIEKHERGIEKAGSTESRLKENSGSLHPAIR